MRRLTAIIAMLTIGLLTLGCNSAAKPGQPVKSDAALENKALPGDHSTTSTNEESMGTLGNAQSRTKGASIPDAAPNQTPQADPGVVRAYLDHFIYPNSIRLTENIPDSVGTSAFVSTRTSDNPQAVL
ncbi:MAG: hypothetical protein ABI743_09760, partial [bacterium]